LFTKSFLAAVHSPAGGITLVETDIPWIHKCVVKTVGCGASHKYTNIQIYCVKYYKLFAKIL